MTTALAYFEGALILLADVQQSDTLQQSLTSPYLYSCNPQAPTAFMMDALCIT